MTQDEAIAAVLADSQPGDHVVIHEATCRARQAPDVESAEAVCSCEPLVLTVGAAAA